MTMLLLLSQIPIFTIRHQDNAHCNYLRVSSIEKKQFAKETLICTSN